MNLWYFFAIKKRLGFLNCLVLEFFSFGFDWRVFGPECKMMKYNRPSYCYIKRCCMMCILRNIDKSITDWSMWWMNSLAFVSHKKSSRSRKWLCGNVFGFRSDFYSENINVIFITIISNMFNWVEYLIRCFFMSSLGTKFNLKTFKYFLFFLVEIFSD